ncbi:trace amine-associated receptor 1-like, partial [Perca fluviatilis]|uniref:trace amine-associated receptor 1-like n=1 Tax=Perca fluviatilis TaxID=8168 RepID=UPI00196483DF
MLYSISPITVVLNLLIIISISHFRQLHTPTNFLLLSLAVSDLLVGLVVMPGEIFRETSCWFLGDLVCATYFLLSSIITVCSIGDIVLISVDRYVAICDPLHYTTKITARRVKFCVFTVIVALYLRVFAAAVSQARAMRSHITAVTLQHSVTPKAKKSELKAARNLGVLVVVFLMCLCPFYFVSWVDYRVVVPSISTSLLILVYFNSCLNPVIYAFLYPWFRKAVKLIVTL